MGTVAVRERVGSSRSDHPSVLQKEVKMKRIVLLGAGVVGAGVLGAGFLITAGEGKTPAITQTSIAGAKLGLPASAYKQLLGKPVRRLRGTVDNPGQPEDRSRLVFSKRKLSVFFVDGIKGSTEITTWNRSYRTAAGVGPCTTIQRLKAAYGNRLKPSKFNTQDGIVYAWTVGKNLIFGSNDRQVVEAVGLYDGSDPYVAVEGGSLAYAGFVTLSERRCS
jgi:hypothetical protein